MSQLNIEGLKEYASRHLFLRGIRLYGEPLITPNSFVRSNPRFFHNIGVLTSFTIERFAVRYPSLQFDLKEINEVLNAIWNHDIDKLIVLVPVIQHNIDVLDTVSCFTIDEDILNEHTRIHQRIDREIPVETEPLFTKKKKEKKQKGDSTKPDYDKVFIVSGSSNEYFTTLPYLVNKLPRPPPGQNIQPPTVEVKSAIAM